MKRVNQFVDTFLDVELSGLKVPVIVIYHNTTDFPLKFAARLFDLEKPTDVVMISKELQEILKEIPSSATRIPRHPYDDPNIIEMWVI